MPLIVVGADTRAGQKILDRLGATEREVRVFVSDEHAGLALRERGFKVATGDVSDDSHIEAAALRCFSAVLITEAATDDRQRAFASEPRDVLTGWARAMEASEVTRVIWVTNGEVPDTRAHEVTSVDPSDPGFADTVIALDDAHSIR